MCFYNDDYEWTASVVEKLDTLSPKNCRCEECGNDIEVGDVCRIVHMQEHEQCQICEDNWSDNYAGWTDEKGEAIAPLPCDSGHDYGNTFDATICLNCLKVREAVKEYELKEGCPEHASEPGYGEWHEVFFEHSNNWEYAEACVAKYPELADHAWIKTLLERDGD